MGDADNFQEQINFPRRSLRLVLSEINELAEESNDRTPNKATSPEEMLIAQRGPRRKPITWSPFDYDTTKLLIRSRDKTPEPVTKKCDMHPRLRRRLILSPTKTPSQDLSPIITRKFKSLKSFESATT